jgi:hypothetical protein
MTGDRGTAAESGSASSRWDAARDQVAPVIGERMTALIGHALLAAAGRDDLARAVAADLRAQGDDPDAPSVTEVESLLLAWARDAGSDAAGSATSRLDGAVSADTRARLDELAAAARSLSA